MTSRRRHLRRVRTTVVLALCVPLSTSAGALAAPAVDRATQQSTPKVGDTPADFAQRVAPAPEAGDTPIDHPGASRAPEYDPTVTIQVVRPERTIVREADEALATILAGLALFVAAGGTAFTLVRTRSPQRGIAGRSH